MHQTGQHLQAAGLRETLTYVIGNYDSLWNTLESSRTLIVPRVVILVMSRAGRYQRHSCRRDDG